MTRFSKCLLVVLVLALAPATAFAGSGDDGKVVKSTGKDAAILWAAGLLFPASPYDNWYQIPGVHGRVNLIQPNGNVDVILGISADALTPLAEYCVHIDLDGTTVPGTWGPWRPMGCFIADLAGHGESNYTAPAGTLAAGYYTWSVYINRADYDATILISDNVEFQIAPAP